MSIKIDDNVLAKLRNYFEEACKALDSDLDIRVALAKLDRITEILEGQMELADNPDTRFALFLPYYFLGYVAFIYGRRNDKWYQLNADNVKAMRRGFSDYMRKIIEALNKRDYNLVVDATKNWFYGFHNLRSEATNGIH